MKGPSLEAIRRFKEQQEQKKREEQDKKVQEKLSTLEHRAARGDKKAKHQLKQIEKIDEERNSRPSEDHRGSSSSSKSNNSRIAQSSSSSSSNVGQKHRPTTGKPKSQGPDFDELMRLAANNKNEIKREVVKESKPIPKLRDNRHRPDAPKKDLPIKQPRPQHAVTVKTVESRPKQPQQRAPASSHSLSRPRQQSLPNPRDLNHRRPYEKPAGYSQVRPRLPIRPNHYRNASYYDEPEDDYEEDEYENDGFVVDEDEDGVQDEIDKTIRSVFRYDKRRCELREQAIDREYRAIGRVSTFEDLEREERRASRLAAAEDAEAQREEEEHKRLKRQRLRQLRD